MVGGDRLCVAIDVPTRRLGETIRLSPHLDRGRREVLEARLRFGAPNAVEIGRSLDAA
jgi:hypothetical protein